MNVVLVMICVVQRKNASMFLLVTCVSVDQATNKMTRSAKVLMKGFSSVLMPTVWEYIFAAHEVKIPLS